ncbi:MAG: tetratricopeptide repeat protein [Pseudomonadota bacterium]
MLHHLSKLGLAGSAVAVLLTISAPIAAAQETGEAALRQEQARLFNDLFEDPDNLDLMFAYALVSIRLKDYEAAISTFDRMLIFNPDQPRVVVELAAAYFRIGSYPIARFYFENALRNPETPSELVPRIEEFLGAIETRTRTSYFTGIIGLSGVATTNANKGPDDRLFEFSAGGAIIETTVTGDEVTAQDDVGFEASARISHFYDLGGLNEDFWRSDLALFTTRFASTINGAADVLVLRSGPRLSLDDDRYGPKARPFVEFDHVRSSNEALYSTVGAGVEYSNTNRPDLSTFGDLRLSWRDYHRDGGDLDGGLLRMRFGATYFYDPEITLRGTINGEYELTDAPEERSVQIGAGGTAYYRYDSGMDFAARNWLVAATARAAYRTFTDDRREDFDLRLDLSHTAYLEDGLAFVVSGEYFRRDSNVSQFNLEGVSLTMGVEIAF